LASAINNTFGASSPRVRFLIACWKGIIEEIHFGGSIMASAIIENLDLEKPSFRPSKWPWKLKPAKNSKLPKLPEIHFEPFGKGGWPPTSTWIISTKWALSRCKECTEDRIVGRSGRRYSARWAFELVCREAQNEENSLSSVL
jgi:hypothetical protein